jgi:hypothetical protein
VLDTARSLGLSNQKPELKLLDVFRTVIRQEPDSVATSRKNEERRLNLFSQVRRHFCWSECVVRGGVEPPIFRFSAVADTQEANSFIEST